MRPIALKTMVLCLGLECAATEAAPAMMVDRVPLCEPDRQAEVYASGSSRTCVPSEYPSPAAAEAPMNPQSELLESQAKTYGRGKGPAQHRSRF